MSNNIELKMISNDEIFRVRGYINKTELKFLNIIKL